MATAKFFANNTLWNKEKTFTQFVRACVVSEDERFPTASKEHCDVHMGFFIFKIQSRPVHIMRYIIT